MNNCKHAAKRLVPALFWVVLSQAAPAWAEGAGMGTLLYSPAERAAILKARRAKPTEGAAPQRARLDGVLRRPDGSVAWIDGERYRHGDNHPFGRVEIGRQSVRIGATSLVPGQTLEVTPDGMRREDVAPDGAIAIRHKRN